MNREKLGARSRQEPIKPRNPHSSRLVVGLGNSWISLILDGDSWVPSTLGNEHYLQIIVIFPWRVYVSFVN